MKFGSIVQAISVITICFASTASSVRASNEPLPLDELQAFTEAYFQIKSNYVKDVKDIQLLRAAIRGMVSELDNHSRYLPPEEFERFNTDNEGEYAGLGLTFNEHKYGIEIREVIKNSPAKAAGLEPGMLVTHIENKSLKFMSSDEAYQMLRGEAGTFVSLTVASSKFPQPKTFKLERQIILLESVSSERLPSNTAYIAISQFTLHSVEEFTQALEELSKQQAIENLIIDLRNNPGGVMEIAVELSDLFISKGPLLISSGRTDDANETFYAHQAAPMADLNVLVMINGSSASASEILAAALQDHRKAVIFGEKSYGKGSIQSIYALSQDSGMKLTTAEYFSPKGKRIQDIGVKPDIEYQKKAEKNVYNVSLLDDPELLQAYHLVSGKK